jgi:hypothetical protein
MIYDMNQIVPVRRAQQLQKQVDEQRKPVVQVETKKCAAWKCDRPISHSFPGLTSIWCTSHTRPIVFDFAQPPPKSRFAAWRARRKQ